MKYYICTSASGVTLEWSKLFSDAKASFKKASKGAKLEVLEKGERHVIRIK